MTSPPPDEPHLTEWQAHGLACLVVRNPYLKAFCGYVAVAPGHPLHGLDWTDAHTIVDDLRVHGGLTYTGKSTPLICHPHEPDNAWWLGFDCAHAYDLVPGLPGLDSPLMGGQYRDIAYVRAEVESLAEQLARAGGAHAEVDALAGEKAP